MASKIVFTGGGTAGHVTPNFAVMDKLGSLYEGRTGQKLDIAYIGMKNSMEQQLVQKQGVAFYGITGGKLRRYVDFKNFVDLFKIAFGCIQSFIILLKLRPRVVFSKGGFVSCPVVWAARLLNVPVIIHESDITPGLANKLSLPFARVICYAFTETAAHVSAKKSIYTGLPVRNQLLSGSQDQGLNLCGFRGEKPIVLVTGGSQGAGSINERVRSQLDTLLKQYDICHIVGKGNLDPLYSGREGYFQLEYAHEELANLYAMAHVVIARAGATTLFELLALKKPHLLFPLSAKVSRGDQVLNAASFEKAGFSVVYPDDAEIDLGQQIGLILQNKEKYQSAMQNAALDGAQRVSDVILTYL